MPTRPAQFEDYAAVLGRYLADGGDSADIITLLLAWEARPAMGEPLVLADLTQDGTPEILVSFINPASDRYPPEATLSIYTCREGAVESLYTYHPGGWFGLNLIGARDLTADGAADLAFTEVACGAHTCWDILHVWSWTGVDFEEQVEGEFSAPYATFVLSEGKVSVGSSGIASMGAGPQRPLTTTLAWNGSAITVAETLVGPALYRYHVFRDGDEALFAGKDARAIVAYQHVLEDNTLLSWDAYMSEDEERRWFSALAHWRLLVQAARANLVDDAQAHYAPLSSDFPGGEAGSPVVSLAQRFWTTFLESNNVAYACRAALDVPEAQTVLDFLNSFGYANPVYTLEDLCPFLTP